MKKSMLPVAFAAAVSLVACGSGSKAGQTAISLSPSTTTTHAAATSSSTSPTSTSSHAASSATSKAAASATITSTKPAAMAPSAPAHSATAHATSAPAVVTPTKAAPTPTKSAPAKTAVAPATPATKVSKVWPGAGWKIQSSDTDLCDGYAGPSPFAKDTFTCGATAASLLACKKDASGNALCIQSYDMRLAVKFHTTAVVTGTAPTSFAPLTVKLQDGTTCSVSSHDQEQHYQGRHGWQYCSNGGTLLLPASSNIEDGDTGNYFNKSGSTWTAQLGMGTSAPTTVKVAQVYYAQ